MQNSLSRPSQDSASQWRHGHWRRLISSGLAAMFLLTGITVWWQISHLARSFERESAAVVDRVSQRLNETDAVLSGLTALYHALDEIDREQLSIYATEMLRRYPHIAYIEYLEKVTRDEVSDFVARLQGEGFLSSYLWQWVGEERIPVEARDFYFPIIFIEPLDPQRAQMLGFDSYSDEPLKLAINKAIDTGGSSASPAFKLIGGQRVYALFKAVYSGRDIPDSRTQRHAQARRMVSLLVKLDELLTAGDLPSTDLNVILRSQVAGSDEITRIVSNYSVNPIFRTLLPKLLFERGVGQDGQHFFISIDKQLGAEVLRPDLLAGATILSLLIMMLLHTRVNIVSERARSEYLLLQQQEQEDITLHAIADAVITTNAEGRVERMNATAENLTGWSLSEARKQGLSEVLPLCDEYTQGSVLNPVVECLQEGRAVRLQEIVVLHNKQGKMLHIMANASPIRNRDGLIIGAVLVFHDVSEERQMQKQLEYQSRHDALTGLLDRAEFESQLAMALQSASASGRQHALCYMDLDQFKIVNDACGHVAGDELLVELSALLLSEVRDTDVLARLGGDEFAILLKDCSLQLAVSKAESLRDAVKNFRFVWQGRRFDAGFAFGIVPLIASSGTTMDVLRAADVACYAAKDKGRNQVFVYDKENIELEKFRGEMRWATRIAEALEDQKFQLYYQTIKPILTDDATLFHCELLMRREDESGGLTSPEEFIPAAERFNLMPDIDRWVVNSALPQIAELSQQMAKNAKQVLCGINLSGQSLGDETFFAYVDNLMDRYAVRGESLYFEITESSAISNFTVALSFIQKMRARGCRFALDDFGTGVSSFSYLKKLPLEYVKIDGSFVRDLLHNPVDEAMVASINLIAHTLGIKTIAEYVESEELLDKLRELGTDYAQGYVISRPAPLAEKLTSGNSSG